MAAPYFGGSVGNIIDTAAKAYGLGKMIRRGPEMEQREDEEYQSGKKARASQQELEDMKLTSARKEQGFADAQRELSSVLNGIQTHELDPNDPTVQDRLHRAGINANVPMHLLGTPELDTHLSTLAGAVANRDYKDPKALESLTAINPLLQTGAADGETKSFRALVPSKAGGFHADLNITDADGKTKTAPLTDKRSAADRDPVTHIPLDGLVGHIVATHELNEAVKSDPSVQAAVAGIQADPNSAERYTQILKGRLAAIQGKEYDPEDDALAKREKRAKVEGAEEGVKVQKAREKFLERGGARGAGRQTQPQHYIASMPDGSTETFDPDADDPTDYPEGTSFTKIGTRPVRNLPPARGGKEDPDHALAGKLLLKMQADYAKSRGRGPDGKPVPAPTFDDAMKRIKPAAASPAAAPAAAKPAADVTPKISHPDGTILTDPKRGGQRLVIGGQLHRFKVENGKPVPID